MQSAAGGFAQRILASPTTLPRAPAIRQSNNSPRQGPGSSLPILAIAPSGTAPLTCGVELLRNSHGVIFNFTLNGSVANGV